MPSGKTGAWIFAVAILAITGLPAAAARADQEVDYFSLSLEDLVDVSVSVASISDLPTDRQPATVTVYTRQDMEALGARYLLDVLEQTPGVFPAVDVFGVTSLVFRGHWGHEGKILLQFDDMPLNGLMYGNLNLALHYPVEQLERVEMIRGAGTAKYGGSAQLAVIRVYTKQCDADAAFARLAMDHVQDAGVGWSAIGGVQSRQDDLKVRVCASASDGEWSGRTWHDNTNGAHDLADEADVSTANLIANADWRDLDVRVFFDRTENLTPHKHGDSRPGETVMFQSLNLMAAYDWKVNDHWTLTPKINYRDQKDWWITRDPTVNPISDYKLPAHWIRGSLEAVRWSESFNLLAGVEGWYEKASAESAGGFGLPAETYYNGEPDVSYDGKAAYAQAEWLGEEFFLSGGARLSDHSYAGDSLVPRVAAGYLADRWYVKAHYGQAFRDPDIDVINTTDLSGGAIDPEKTNHSELEAGVHFPGGWRGTLAVYRLEIENPIIYTSTGSGFYYTNNPESTTRGVETTLAGSWRDLGVRFGLSHYQAVETPTAYEVAGDDDVHLGAPRTMASLALSWAIDETWTLLPSVLWHGDYWAYDYEAGASDPDGDELSVQEQSAKTFVNLTLRWRRDAWMASLGAHDLLDEGRLLPQPFNDASTPYPMPGRQVRLAVSKQWSF